MRSGWAEASGRWWWTAPSSTGCCAGGRRVRAGRAGGPRCSTTATKPSPGWPPPPSRPNAPAQEPRHADLGSDAQHAARGGGLEPPTTGPEPAVLPITPPPNGRAATLPNGPSQPHTQGDGVVDEGLSLTALSRRSSRS